MLSSAIDEYATVDCANSRSRQIISTFRLPEIIHEMETVAHWIDSFFIKRYIYAFNLKENQIFNTSEAADPTTAFSFQIAFHSLGAPFKNPKPI